VSYVHDYSATLNHRFVGSFPVTIGRSSDTVTVEATSPSTARVETADQGMGYAPFIEPERASADLRGICGRSEPLIECREGGEIDVPFSDASLYARSQRLRPSGQNPCREIQQNSSGIPFRMDRAVSQSEPRFIPTVMAQRCPTYGVKARRVDQALGATLIR